MSRDEGDGGNAETSAEPHRGLTCWCPAISTMYSEVYF
jgi:hypothetical protein